MVSYSDSARCCWTTDGLQIWCLKATKYFNMVHLLCWVEIVPGLFFSCIWCHLVSLGVSQLETRLFRIIYDDLTYNVWHLSICWIRHFDRGVWKTRFQLLSLSPLSLRDALHGFLSSYSDFLLKSQDSKKPRQKMTVLTIPRYGFSLSLNKCVSLTLPYICQSNHKPAQI